MGRINLLVGLNNSGKTSVLEAVGLLASGGNLRQLWSTMSSRGEWLHSEREPQRQEPGLALPYLFHGYRVDQGSTIELSSERSDGSSASLRMTIKEPPSPRPSEWQRPPSIRRYSQEGEEAEPILGCLEVSVGDRVEHEVPIVEGWGIAREDIIDSSGPPRARDKDEVPALDAVGLIFDADEPEDGRWKTAARHCRSFAPGIWSEPQTKRCGATPTRS